MEWMLLFSWLTVSAYTYQFQHSDQTGNCNDVLLLKWLYSSGEIFKISNLILKRTQMIFSCEWNIKVVFTSINTRQFNRFFSSGQETQFSGANLGFLILFFPFVLCKRGQHWYSHNWKKNFHSDKITVEHSNDRVLQFFKVLTATILF